MGHSLMARPGPPPKPRELKLVQGTLRKDRDTPDRPEPDVQVPSCPAWLGREAKREWKRIAPELERLGLIALVDRAALAGYCQAYQRWYDAEKILADEGLTFVTEKGYVGQRPEVAIANTAMKEMRAFLQEFGMTPAARTRVRSAKGARKKNPFETL